MGELRMQLKKDLDEINYLIVDSRKLLSILQKIMITSERTKGWVLGDLIGSWVFTRQSKYNGYLKIRELMKEAKQMSFVMKRNFEKSNIAFELSSINYFMDYFLSSSLANLVQLQKVRKLKKDVNEYSIELENEILLLEQKEEELLLEWKKMTD